MHIIIVAAGKKSQLGSGGRGKGDGEIETIYWGPNV